jgi:hypothetical protein
MEMGTSWKSVYLKELRAGWKARQAGNEGRARVCARRAAGSVIQEYLRRRGIEMPRFSAYDYLRYLSSLPEISDRVREITDRFLVRVSPDHTLPVDVDLLRDAEQLVFHLLEE